MLQLVWGLSGEFILNCLCFPLNFARRCKVTLSYITASSWVWFSCFWGLIFSVVTSTLASVVPVFIRQLFVTKVSKVNVLQNKLRCVAVLFCSGDVVIKDYNSVMSIFITWICDIRFFFFFTTEFMDYMTVPEHQWFKKIVHLNY